jgi:hypothetical protein
MATRAMSARKHNPTNATAAHGEYRRTRSIMLSGEFDMLETTAKAKSSSEAPMGDTSITTTTEPHRTYFILTGLQRRSNIPRTNGLGALFSYASSRL